MRHHGEEDEQPGLGREAEREPDPEPVDEAVQRQPGRAKSADLGVRVDVLCVVSVVEDERPLGDEEEDEAGADEEPEQLRVIQRLGRFGQHLEERHRDDDSPRERDRGRELARAGARQTAVEKDGQPGERYGQRHAPGRLSLPPGGAGLRERLTPLAPLQPRPRTSVLATAYATRAAPQERDGRHAQLRQVP